MPEEMEPEATGLGKHKRVTTSEDEAVLENEPLQDDDSAKDDDTPIRPTGTTKP